MPLAGAFSNRANPHGVRKAGGFGMISVMKRRPKNYRLNASDLISTALPGPPALKFSESPPRA